MIRTVINRVSVIARPRGVIPVGKAVMCKNGRNKLGPDKLCFFHPLFYSLILEKCVYYSHKKSDCSHKNLIIPQKRDHKNKIKM